MATGSESRGTVKTKNGYRTPSKSAAAIRRENLEKNKKFFSNRQNLTGIALKKTTKELLDW
jgi:hypothetical protein